MPRLVLVALVCMSCGGPIVGSDGVSTSQADPDGAGGTRDGGAGEDSAGQEDGGDSGSQDASDAGAGGDDEGGTGGAIGAPIRIPREVQDQGRPLAEVTAEIERGIREQCGNDGLCVRLITEERDDSFTRCQFVKTEPPQQTQVPRGSTVVIVAGSRTCESEDPGTGETPGEGTIPSEAGTPPDGQTSPDEHSPSEADPPPEATTGAGPLDDAAVSGGP